MAGSYQYSLLTPVRRRHRHRLRLAGWHLRVEHRNPALGRGVLQRIDHQEAVVPPVHAVDRSVHIGGRVALVRRQLVVRERRRAAPVPHREDQIAFEPLRPRRRRWHLARADPVRPVRVHLQAARAPEHADGLAHAGAVLACLHAAVPRVDALGERAERLGNLTRGLIPQLMADVAVDLDLTDPVMLREHLRADAVARRPGPGKFGFGREC